MKFSKRIHIGYFHTMKPKLDKPKDMIEYVPSADRRQGRNRRVLTLDEKLEIS